MLAFGMSSIATGLKNDPTMFKWIARKDSVTPDGKANMKFFPVRKCTTEDYEKLYVSDQTMQVRL